MDNIVSYRIDRRKNTDVFDISQYSKISWCVAILSIFCDTCCRILH